VVPLPGARELLAHLHERQVPFAIATSGARHTAGSALALLGLPDDVPVVTRDFVKRAKPDPHLFLVGDSVWDLLAAQRAGALGIGLLSGGYGREDLERSGAYRVYADPAEMLTRLEEVGVRPIRSPSAATAVVASQVNHVSITIVSGACRRERKRSTCRSLVLWPMPRTCGTTPSWCPRG
jgi:ribonucleotide monophosphatase NagD (HAD superfamily)